ncbi:MAG TPA: hypothetical protein VFV02_06940 [Acidimicrobiales bacterium]|nr:hypothetical protein [Acidimicrobiales bacterium]
MTAVLPSSGRPHGAQSAHGAPTSNPPPATRGAANIRSTLAAVNGIIDQTGTGRQKVVAAIDSVQSCTMTPADGQAAIAEVVTERQRGMTQLRRLDASASTAPADRSVVQSLMAVIDDSVQADQDYAAWMGDVGSGQPSCRVPPMNDANFAAGQIFSAKADSDKEVFVRAWNPLAGAAGLNTYNPQDF